MGIQILGQLTLPVIPVPRTSSEASLEKLLYLDWAVASNLIYHAGKPLAQVISTEANGFRILSGSADGRGLFAGLQHSHAFTIMLTDQMYELIQGSSQ
ncbi:Iterative polyketide synthase CazM [Fusarium oxysporum f. sp. conglutinans]|nr:Iterative polyketide synthase CazM [Fusarium oxysporum f. sp. conglutinans]